MTDKIFQQGVYNMPSEYSFLDVMASSLLHDFGHDPLAFRRVTVFLPTRRACRLLAECLLEKSQQESLVLPKMYPLADLDDEDIEFQLYDKNLSAEIKPAISSLERQLILTQCLLKAGFYNERGEVEDLSLSSATHLSQQLCGFLDQVQSERLSLSEMKDLVPEAYAVHWQKNLDFLNVISQQWPRILESIDKVDPMQRVHLLLEKQTKAWEETPTHDYVIAAGSTGSHKTTAKLLDVIARLPNGTVVLPGLDQSYDVDTSDIKPTHPQYGLRALLSFMEVNYRDVSVFQGCAQQGQTPSSEKVTYVNQLMRDEYHCLPQGEKGLKVVSCATLEEEASVISLYLRDALEKKDIKKAALISMNDDLKGRVQQRLKKWGVDVYMNEGQKLEDLSKGVYLILTARLLFEEFSPHVLMAVLKHPLSRLCFESKEIMYIEQQLVRGHVYDSLSSFLEKNSAENLLAIQSLSSAFNDVASDLDVQNFSKKSSAHLVFSEKMLSNHFDKTGERLWVDEEGQALSSLFEVLLKNAQGLGRVNGAGYVDFISKIFSSQKMAPPSRKLDKIVLLGPLEARLQKFDLTILGGMNEGVWPPDLSENIWLSKSMRASFGLLTPERRVGLAAHDFVQFSAGKNVILTRAEKEMGRSSVPSRWLSKVLKSDPALLDLSFVYLSRRLHHQVDGLSFGPPEPVPPIHVRPRSYSVSDVALLTNNPYAFYVHRILKLSPLQPMDSQIGALERGILIHDIFREFVETYHQKWPGDPYSALLEVAKKYFDSISEENEVTVFWWQQFKQMAKWFVEQEARRQSDVQTSHAEIKGEFMTDLEILIKAKADRIDVFKDGRVEIIDYKTGMPPRKGDVQTGMAPQLPLEAWILQEGGFPKVRPSQNIVLSYWKVGKESKADSFEKDVPGIVEATKDLFYALMSFFVNQKSPFLAYPHGIPDVSFHGEYDHLARVKEWS